MIRQTGDPKLVTFFQSLSHVVFDACMHGGDRDKRTKFLCSPGLFEPLAVDCDNKHTHASWVPRLEHGRMVFPTAAEAAIRRHFAPAHVTLSSRSCPTIGPHDTPRSPSQGLDYHGSRSPKLASTPNGFPSFWALNICPTQSRSPHINSWRLLHHGGARLRHQVRPAIRGRDSCLSTEFGGNQRSFSTKPKRCVPVDGQNFLHPAAIDAVHRVVSAPVLEMARDRLRAALKVKSLRVELEQQEKVMKDAMRPDVRSRLSIKNIKLFEPLLKSLDYPDMGVIDLMRDGVPMVGWQSPPQGLRENLIPATMTAQELEDSAIWRRRSIMGAGQKATPRDEHELLKAASAEVEAGFLQGPFTEQEMTDHLGRSDWLLNPRFALHQGNGGKVRVIDDARQSALNCAYSSTVKLQLQDSDYIAAMLRYAMTVQSTVDTDADERWLGKTLDLSKAYKQLAVQPDHQHLTIVGFPVGDKWHLYKSIALPFGATGSVYGFVRVSQALWFLLTKLLHTVTLCYFDDFPVIEKQGGCKVLSSAMSSIRDSLGWLFARSGQKSVDFAEAFDALGVTFLAKLHLGEFVVRNKPSRIAKICSILEGIAEAGTITSAQASQVQGLLNFACGFYSTKACKQLVSCFAPLADLNSKAKAERLGLVCKYAINLLTRLRPRKHRLTTSCARVHGRCLGRRCSIGRRPGFRLRYGSIPLLRS